MTRRCEAPRDERISVVARKLWGSTDPQTWQASVAGSSDKLRDKLRWALTHLPVMSRAVLAPMPQARIARIVGVSQSIVCDRRSRAVRELIRLVETPEGAHLDIVANRVVAMARDERPRTRNTVKWWACTGRRQAGWGRTNSHNRALRAWLAAHRGDQDVRRLMRWHPPRGRDAEVFLGPVAEWQAWDMKRHPAGIVSLAAGVFSDRQPD